MDPDKALEELRQKMASIQKVIDEEGTYDELIESANRAVDLWNGLDRWMTMAGALPRDWARHR